MYDFTREQHIEESLEAQGFRPVPGKAKQERSGPCIECRDYTANLAWIDGRAEYLCAPCSAKLRCGE
jgi:hypothetical protein